jgi:choline kinase
VNSASWVPVRDAVVLAAGNGDRFKNGARQSKLLEPVLGRPLILRTLDTAAQAGISSFHIVVGYQADKLRAVIERDVPRGTAVHFTYNPDWHLENGVSVLAVRERLRHRRFALLMGDHLFEPSVLARLLQMTLREDESVLAIDGRPAPAIGKALGTYDALDTGLFVCAPELFDALDIARRRGDTTLSGGIRELSARGLMRGADVGGASWYDIDTLADLATAETLLASEPASEVA